MAYYVNNTDLEDLIRRHLQGDPEAKEPLGSALLLVCQGVASKFVFKGLDKTEAAYEAFLHVWSRLDKFKPTRGKAFNFCTTIALNHMRQVGRKEATYQTTKARLLVRAWEEDRAG